MFKPIFGVTVLAFAALTIIACNDTSSANNDVTLSSSSANNDVTLSSSSESSSSQDTIGKTCIEVGACDAMVKDDVSTWNFVREDNFGDDMKYTYSVDEKTLILTTVDSNGDVKVNSTTYSFYDMTIDSSIEMAFNAAKSTCKSGGGNKHVKEVCE